MAQKSRPAEPALDWITQILADVEGFWDEAFPDLDWTGVRLFTSLGFLSRQILNFHGRTLKREGRQLTEYQTLAQLRVRGPASPSELNLTLQQTPAGMTHTINQLEKASLVRRRRDPRDGRSVRVELTRTGKQEAERLMKLQASAQLEVVGRMSTRERKAVLEAVERLITVVSEASRDSSGGSGGKS